MTVMRALSSEFLAGAPVGKAVTDVGAITVHARTRAAIPPATNLGTPHTLPSKSAVGMPVVGYLTRCELGYTPTGAAAVAEIAVPGAVLWGMG